MTDSDSETIFDDSSLNFSNSTIYAVNSIKRRDEPEISQAPSKRERRILNNPKVQRKTPSQSTLDAYQDEIESLYSLGKEIDHYVNQPENQNVEGFDAYPGVESMDYDYAAERKDMYSSNIFVSIAHYVKGGIGSGILGIHEAFMYGGIWTSCVVAVFIALVSTCSVLLLVGSAQKMYVRLRVPKLSYPDLAEVSVATGPMKRLRKYSKIFRYIVDIFLMAELLLFCSTFQLVIATVLKKFLEKESTAMYSNDFHLAVYVAMTIVPLGLLCMIRSIKSLAFFSIVADVMTATCIIAAMYYGIRNGHDFEHLAVWKNVYGLFRCIGVCLFCMNGTTIALPIENSMRKPKYFRTVILFGMPIVLALTVTIGIIGYWGWGEDCQTPIIVQMPVAMLVLLLSFFSYIFIRPDLYSSMMRSSDILQLMLAVMICITFTIHFWVPFRIAWHYIGRRIRKKRKVWERVFKVLQVLLISIISSAFPNLIKNMSFAGNVLLSIISFIFPAIINSLVTWKDHKGGIIRWRLLRNIVMAVFGLTLCAGGIYTILPLE